MWHQIRMPPQAREWLAGVLGRAGFRVALLGLDAAYQQQLVALSRVRRAAADVATSRKRLELHIGDLERQAGGGDTAGLRRRYAELQAKEERISAASRRLMADVNAFRDGKQAIKAAYTAAGEAADAVWAEVNRDPTARS
jgi:phage shock protein A